MRDVLSTCLAARDPDQRDIYRALYGVFAEAFREIDGLISPSDLTGEEVEAFGPSPAGLEDAMDGWDPEEGTDIDYDDDDERIDPDEEVA